MSYKDLEIYQIAYKLAIEVHKISLTFPKYELYEQGSQIRRSSKSIKDTIVEGYGRKRYKDDFIKFLTYAQSSCDESISQLTMISDIHFPNQPLTKLIDEYDILGKKLINSYNMLKKNGTSNQKLATRNKYDCLFGFLRVITKSNFNS